MATLSKVAVAVVVLDEPPVEAIQRHLCHPRHSASNVAANRVRVDRQTAAGSADRPTHLVIMPVAGDTADPAEEDEPVGAIPGLDHVQPFVDFSPQRLRMQIPAEEQGFCGLGSGAGHCRA